MRGALLHTGPPTWHWREFDDGQKDDEYTFTGGLNYELYANVRAALRYEFRLQDSTVEASEFTENRVTVSLRITF